MAEVLTVEVFRDEATEASLDPVFTGIEAIWAVTGALRVASAERTLRIDEHGGPYIEVAEVAPPADMYAHLGVVATTRNLYSHKEDAHDLEPAEHRFMHVTPADSPDRARFGIVRTDEAAHKFSGVRLLSSLIGVKHPSILAKPCVLAPGVRDIEDALQNIFEGNTASMTPKDLFAQLDGPPDYETFCSVCIHGLRTGTQLLLRDQ